MSDNTKPAVQIKAKSDPEALLNDLSASLKSFQSTVRTWTTSSTLPPTSTHTLNSSDTTTTTAAMRQARLGLGAKAQRQTVAGDSVAGNIALKNQLTKQKYQETNQNQKNNHLNHKNKQNNHKNANAYTNNNNNKVTKPSTKKRGDSDDNDDIGRASLIKSRTTK